MSATQVALLVLALVIFVAGWAARGRRELHERLAARTATWVADFDRAIGAALTSFQAVLALWQVKGQASSGLADRVLETFEQRRHAVTRRAADLDLPPEAHEALAKVGAGLDRLSSELAAFSEGMPLDTTRERGLFRAERELVAARTELLLAAAGMRATDDSPKTPRS